MRRDARKHEEGTKNNSILYIGASILGIGVIAFVLTFVLYGNKMEEQSEIGNGKIAELMQEAAEETKQETEAASTQMGKSVEESKNEIVNTNTNTNTNTALENKVNNTKTNTTKDSSSSKETTKTETSTTAKAETNKEETKKEISFVKPVEGEISKAYAKENLVYSETLQEWTTHLGIDIKAEKTTVVKVAEAGKVKSIKNDPRYGLSIIIEHQDGYETLYANLLSSEFVQVGEEVSQGQSIGTVGNTATFEIADDAHLHFEISKDGESLDPTGLIK